MRVHTLCLPLFFTILLLLPAGGEPSQAAPPHGKSPTQEELEKEFQKLESSGDKNAIDNQKIKRQVEFNEKIRQLAEQKAYVQALDLLEAQYEKNARDDFSFMSETQEEVMSVLYEKAGQLERGVDFLIKNKKTGKERKYKFDETLFDLAIKTGRLEVAQSIAKSEKLADVEKLYYEAQLQGARGNAEECLRLTRDYLEYGFAESGCQILVRPGFIKMHGNPQFQALMVKAQENVRKRRTENRPDRESSPPPKPLTPEEVGKLVSAFRTVKDQQAARSPSAEVRDAVQKIAPQVAGCKKELLDLLRAEKESAYCRMILAGMLVSLEEADLTRNVAEEIRNDDFHLYPDLLFRLAYLIARTSPRDAKPILAQLLKTSGGGLMLPQHAMTMGWDMQLFQAYGVAEIECVDELIKTAGQPGGEAGSALRLLVMFQEPRVVPLLSQHIRSESQPDARKALIEMLSRVILPESRKSLEALAGEIQDREIQDLLRRKAGEMRPPPTELHPLKGGTAVLDPKMKDILFSNLSLTHGQDVSFIDKSIFLSVTRDDIPRLRQLRSRILFRMSDEGWGDYGLITSIILWLQWAPARPVDAPSPKPVAPAPPQAAPSPKPGTEPSRSPSSSGVIEMKGTKRFQNKDFIYSISFSPDGKTLAVAGGDDTIHLWDAATGKEIRSIKGGSEYVTFSPDGKTLASGSWGKRIRLWETATGKELLTIPFNATTNSSVMLSALSVAYSPDGKVLALGSVDTTIRLWETAEGKKLVEMSGHKDMVRSVAFSPDGKTLASGSNDRTVRLWDAATGKERMVLGGHADEVRAVAFSPDGSLLASGSPDRSIRLWNAATGKELRKIDGKDYVHCIAFSPDGKTMVSGGRGGSVRLWEVSTGKELFRTEGHKEGEVLSVAFSPDGKTAASGGLDGTIRLWDAATGKDAQKIDGHVGVVKSVAFLPDGMTLASGGGDGRICLWDATTGEERLGIEGGQRRVFSIAVSSDGKMLASAGDDMTIRLRDVSTLKERHRLGGHTHPVQAVAFSPDGKMLASGSGDQTIRLWETATGKNVLKIDTMQGTIFSLSYSPDGKMLASGGGDGTARLWETATGKELYQFEGGESGTVRSVVISSDGKTLAAGVWRNSIRFWDVTTKKQIRNVIPDSPSCSVPIALSPDGKTLAAGNNMQLRLWDSATGNEILTIEVKQRFEACGGIEDLAFSPDGKRIATAHSGATILAWDVASLLKDRK